MATNNITIDQLRKNHSSSTEEYEIYYENLLEEFANDSLKLNVKVVELKLLCLSRGVDHTRFKYATIPHSSHVKVAANQHTVPASSEKKTAKIIDMEAVLKAYGKSFGFLTNIILKVESESEFSGEKLLILHGKSLKEYTSFDGINQDKAMPIEDFKKEVLDLKFTWIILIIFHPTDKEIEKKLITLKGYFPEILYFDQEDYRDNELTYWRKNSKKILSHIFLEDPCILIHENLNSEYECLIKRFFGNSTGFLTYSDLKGGYSGSKVLLVSPVGGVGDNRKFVLKISPKEDEKIKLEIANYKNYVEPYWTSGQIMAADWQESPNLHAIRYPFASTDTICTSISFTAKYSACKEPEQLKSVIQRIFQHPLQQKWRDQSRSRNATFQKAFDKNLKTEKTLDSLKELLHISSAISIDIAKLKSIIEKHIDYLECINHGDLHSDNIQVQDDEEVVFLIDFGLTGTYPIGLDYATLEASIRYKLLDFSIDSTYLQENHINQLSNFDNLIFLEKEFSNEAEKALKACSVIRESFLNHFSSSISDLTILKKQYLQCLLAITLRQLNYPELNRRYMLLILENLIKELE